MAWGMVGAHGRSRQALKGKEGTQEHVMLRSQNGGSLSETSRVLAPCLSSWAGQRLKRGKGEGGKPEDRERVPSLGSLTCQAGLQKRDSGREEQDRRQVLRIGPPGGG